MMADERPGQTSRRGGFTLYPMYLVYAVVAALALFWTWKVLIAFAILWLAAMLFSYVDDRRHRTPIADSAAEPPAGYSCSPTSEEREACHCPHCGGELFSVNPGVTTKAEIVSFARQAEGWQTNPDALEGWMPPGIYCLKGCTAIHSTPPGPPPDLAAPRDEEDGIPRPRSIRWADVMRDGGSYVLVYTTERQESVKLLLKVITTGTYIRTGYQRPLLVTVDPATGQKKARRELNWEEADQLGKLLLAVLATSNSPPEKDGAARALELIRYLSLSGGL